MNEESLNPAVIKISKEATMKDLIKQLDTIPEDYIVIMKRNPKSSVSSVEILSEEKNLDRKLSKLKINDGVNLFVEDNWIPHPDTLEYEYLQ